MEICCLVATRCAEIWRRIGINVPVTISTLLILQGSVTIRIIRRIGTRFQRCSAPAVISPRSSWTTWYSSSVVSTVIYIKYIILRIFIILSLYYTGWLVTGGTSGKGAILREKRSRKYRIKIFHLRLCFRENRLWIFARYACTLSRLVITDLSASLKFVSAVTEN